MKTIVFALLITLTSCTGWNIKPPPENDTMYFEIVFENDTVIHKSWMK